MPHSKNRDPEFVIPRKNRDPGFVRRGKNRDPGFNRNPDELLHTISRQTRGDLGDTPPIPQDPKIRREPKRPETTGRVEPFATGEGALTPTPNYGKLVDRITSVEGLMNEQPSVAGWLAAGADLATRHVAKVANGFLETQRWMDELDSFGEVQGALAGARLKAEDYNDPEMKGTALSVLDALQKLSPDQQQVFLMWQRGMLSGMQKQAAAQIVAGVLEETGVVEARAVEGKVAVAGEGGVGTETQESAAAIPIVAALKNLFPGIGVHISDDMVRMGDPHLNRVANFIMTPLENETFLDWAYDRSGSLQRLGDIMGEMAEGKRAVGLTALKNPFNYISVMPNIAWVGWDLVTAGIGSGSRTIEKAITGKHYWTDAIGDELAMAQESLATVAIIPVVGMGLDPQDPDYEENLTRRMEAFGIVTMFAGAGAGAAFRHVKTARRVPGKEAAAKVLAEARSVPRSGIMGTAAELYKLPIRKLTEQVDKFAIRFARDPETWWKQGLAGKNGARVIRRIEAARKAHPGDIQGQVGFLHEAYGTRQLGTEMLKDMLKQNTHDGIRRTFVRHVTKNETELGKIRARRGALAHRRAVIIEDLVKRRVPDPDGQVRVTPGEEPGLPPVPEGHQRIYRGQGGVGKGVVGGHSFTDTPQAARRYGDDVVYVDVPQEIIAQAKRVAKEQGDVGYNLTDEWAGKTKDYPKELTPDEQRFDLDSPEMRGKGDPIENLEGMAEVVAKKNELTNIELELKGVNDQIGRYWDDTPFLRYPRATVVRAAVRNVPSSRIERMISFLTGTKKRYDLARLVDEFHRRDKLTVPGTPEAKAGWRHDNIDVISRRMRLHKVPPKVIQKRIGQMLEADSPRKFFQIIHEEIWGETGDIARALDNQQGAAGALHLDPDLRKRLLTLSDSALAGRTRAWITKTVDGFKMRVPVLGRRIRPGQYTPVPSSPTEHLGAVYLPDLDLVMQANSFVNRLATVTRKKGKIGKAGVAMTYDLPRLAIGLSTAMLKPLVLLVRLPAMIMRIQMEQVVRSVEFGYSPGSGKGMAAFPGGIPVPFTGKRTIINGVPQVVGRKRIFESLFGKDGWKLIGPDPRLPKGVDAPSPETAGMLMSELLEDVPSERVQQSTLDLQANQRSVRLEDLEGRRQDLQAAHNDRLRREIAIRNFDRDEILRALDDEPYLKNFMDQNQQSILDELGMSREEWLDNEIEYVKQLTLENPEVLDVVKTGRVRKGAGLNDDVVLPDGRRVADVYTDLDNDVMTISSEIKERIRRGYPEDTPNYPLEQNEADIAAMAHIKREKLRKMRELEDVYGEAINGQGVSIDDAGKARVAIREHWETGRWEYPEYISVEKKVRPGDFDDGLAGQVRKINTAVANAMYRPFKRVSRADLRGTRGSLYHRAYARHYRELKARGYGEAEARSWSQALAGETTRDLMYDLSARTPVQMSMRHLFWFLPAFQEVLYTWAIKVPSQSYWPIGAAALAAKAGLAKRLLKEVGLVQEDSRGEDIITVPGMSQVVGALTGTQVPEISFGKLSGLNLVTTGGGVPGISSPGGWVLGKAALKYGGIFKEISDVLQPYGPETAISPAPLLRIWESVFGNPFPVEFLSPELIKAQWDRSFDVGVQYAFNDLREKGITAPKPEDYGTLEEDKTWTLTPDDEVRYKADSEKYLNRLLDLGKDYARGTAFVRLIGSTISPMALYTTSDEQQTWTKFWENVVAPAGFGEEGLSERQKELIDAHIAQHPESFAYSTFYTKYGAKERDLPFKEEVDDNFYDEYLTGEKEVMEPRDFSLKMMAISSLRHYQNRTDTALDVISPDRNAWELLVNGWKRNGAIQSEREAWDRWLHLNPEADALLTESRKFWLDRNKVPVKSYEAERLGQTSSFLKQIAPMLTGEETFRPKELRFVMSEIAQLYSEHESEFGKPNTKSEKDMAWWFDNVMDPYLKETEVLYQQAQDLEARGLSPAPMYDAIRKIANRPPPNKSGVQVPSVEEVFFGNRPEIEQRGTVLKWQTRPLTWLSNFQLEKAWPGQSEEVIAFLDQASAYDNAFWEFIVTKGIHPSSEDYDKALAARDQQLGAAAAAAGEAVQEAWALSEAQPSIRLTTAGYGRGSQFWQQTVDASATAVAQLEANELSARGFSEEAIKMKAYIYSGIEKARASDPAYDKLWEGLSDIMPLPNGVPREGAALYEAILFGNFNTDFIPYEIASIGGP